MTARDTLPAWRRFGWHSYTTSNGLTMRAVTAFGVTFAATVSPDGGWQYKGRKLRNFEVVRDDEGDTVSRSMPVGPAMIGYAYPKRDTP
jgi:hypothetical protein